MSAVERLEAAIDKLKALRESADPAPWSSEHYRSNGWDNARSLVVYGESKRTLSGVMSWESGRPVSQVRATADLIVTLHRTIDAQLAILRNAVAFYWADPDCHQVSKHVVALADAILGDQS